MCHNYLGPLSPSTWFETKTHHPLKREFLRKIEVLYQHQQKKIYNRNMMDYTC